MLRVAFCKSSRDVSLTLSAGHAPLVLAMVTGDISLLLE